MVDKLLDRVPLIYLVLHSHFEEHFLLGQILLLTCRLLRPLTRITSCPLSSPWCSLQAISRDLLRRDLLHLVVLCGSLLRVSLRLGLRLQLLILLNFLHELDLLFFSDARMTVLASLDTPAACRLQARIQTRLDPLVRSQV